MSRLNYRHCHAHMQFANKIIGGPQLLSMLRHDLIFFKTRLTLNAPMATKVVCFSRLLKCLRSLYGKQC